MRSRGVCPNSFDRSNLISDHAGRDKNVQQHSKMFNKAVDIPLGHSGGNQLHNKQKYVKWSGALKYESRLSISQVKIWEHEVVSVKKEQIFSPCSFCFMSVTKVLWCKLGVYNRWSELDKIKLNRFEYDFWLESPEMLVFRSYHKLILLPA